MRVEQVSPAGGRPDAAAFASLVAIAPQRVLAFGACNVAQFRTELRGTSDSQAAGRKLVMGDRVEEEAEAVASVLGPDIVLAGFCANGEISPFKPGEGCKLHNQTMTIRYFSEAD